MHFHEKNRIGPVLTAIGVLVAAATLYPDWARRARIGRHLPTPSPGTVPAMARGLRTRPP